MSSFGPATAAEHAHCANDHTRSEACRTANDLNVGPLLGGIYRRRGDVGEPRKVERASDQTNKD